jgi:hypothetical protein
MKSGKKQRDNICVVCEAPLAKFTAAKTSHMRKHVRDGSIKEKKDKSGRLEWFTTGKAPQAPQAPQAKKIPVQFKSRYHSKSHIERQQVVAKSNKKGDIFIKCRTCGEWLSAMVVKDIVKDGKIQKNIKMTQDFADGRFICIICRDCNKITPFPKRALAYVLSNVGKECVE